MMKSLIKMILILKETKFASTAFKPDALVTQIKPQKLLFVKFCGGLHLQCTLYTYQPPAGTLYCLFVYLCICRVFYLVY